MATPGPIVHYACSVCGNTFGVQTWNSGNTIGAKQWSDGRTEAPMMPSTPWFGPCPNCREVIWLKDCREIGEDWGMDLEEALTAKNDSSPSIPHLSMFGLTLQDVERGIARASENLGRQLRVRILFMQMANDGLRVPPLDDHKGLDFCSSESRANNLRALAQLLESTSESYLLLGEVYRELGEFDLALRALENAKPSEAWAKRQMSAWATARDSTVRDLQT